MKKFSTVLDATMNTAEQSGGSKGISSTPVHGSTMTAGPTNTQYTKPLNKQTEVELNEQSLQSQSNQHSVTLGQCEETKKMVANIFNSCCSVFPTYGKSADQMAGALTIFNMVLWDYSGEQIKTGFTVWMTNNNTFPTPADIVNIIERDGKPAFDKSVYITMTNKKKTQPESLSSNEWAYIREYEQHIIG